MLNGDQKNQIDGTQTSILLLNNVLQCFTWICLTNLAIDQALAGKVMGNQISPDLKI